MTYRTISVDGKEYKFTVGKQYTKIVSVGLFENAKIGTMKTIPQYCGCCGTPLSELYSDHVDNIKLAVTPANVSRVIKEHVNQIKTA